MQLRLRKNQIENSESRFSKSLNSTSKRKHEEDTALAEGPKASKRTKYVHSQGNTPFPDHFAPTPEQCLEVKKLLEAAHGESTRPTEIVVNNSVSGCGEVPSVLDALMRTILSANTSNTNSARAFQRLIDRFGLLKDKPHETDSDDGLSDPHVSDVDEDTFEDSGFFDGEPDKPDSFLQPSVDDVPDAIKKARSTGVGSVNWDAVRKAPIQALFETIRCGGLAKIKSASMKSILDDVWEEGKQRKREAHAAAGKPPIEPEHEQGELTLDYLHDWDDEAVKAKLMSYKGVGVKTASCVLLFCLKRESFAVDTHIFRLTKFLGWVPQNATRETAAFHLDTRIPNDLKYSLHNLLIRHGRMCLHCRGNIKTSVGIKKESNVKKESDVKKETAIEDQPKEDVFEEPQVNEDVSEKLQVMEANPSPSVFRTRAKKVKVESTRTSHSTKVKKETVIKQEDMREEKVPLKTKRTKKVWVGNGLMKEVVVELETDDEGGELEQKTCVLEHLVNRVRKERRS